MSAGVFWTNKPNMNGFDEAAKSMIREATEFGWQAKLGTRGHMVMRAPDKVTTATIPPDVSAPRARENYFAPIKKWKRENLTNPDTRPKYACDKCDYVAESANGLQGHRISNHSKPRICEYCQKRLPTPAAYGLHVKSHLRSIAEKAGLPTYEYKGKTFDVHKEDEKLVEVKEAGPKKPPAPKIPPIKTAKAATPKKAAPAKAVATTAPKKSTVVIDQGVDYSSFTVEQLIARYRDLVSVMDELIKRLGDQQAKLELIQEAFRAQ